MTKDELREKIAIPVRANLAFKSNGVSYVGRLHLLEAKRLTNEIATKVIDLFGGEANLDAALKEYQEKKND